jgi:uncharacterized cupredoxin-like copper-binding protein
MKRRLAASIAALAVLGLCGVARSHDMNHDEPSHDQMTGMDMEHAHQSRHAAFGRPANAKTAKRSIDIEMSDTLRFNPSELAIKKGESVRFVMKNTGKLEHEFVLGTMDELKAHAEMMKKDPGMKHKEANELDVAPGKTGAIGWQFTKAGEFYYGCLVPGHLEAGMIGKIVVR